MGNYVQKTTVVNGEGDNSTLFIIWLLYINLHSLKELQGLNLFQLKSG